MKIKSKNQFLAVSGSTLGLLGTIFGMHMSSVIDATPAIIGIICAVWCAVSASIIGRMTSNSIN